MSLVGDIALIAHEAPQRVVIRRVQAATQTVRLGSWRTHPQRCHAGACHAPAVAFGAHGDLCWPCFERYQALIARLVGR